VIESLEKNKIKEIFNERTNENLVFDKETIEEWKKKKQL